MFALRALKLMAVRALDAHGRQRQTFGTRGMLFAGEFCHAGLQCLDEAGATLAGTSRKLFQAYPVQPLRAAECVRGGELSWPWVGSLPLAPFAQVFAKKFRGGARSDR